jgi:hypothetical protein
LNDKCSKELLAAIENLVDAKLHDALSRPDGLARLVGHRASGAASYPIRKAERDLETSIARCRLKQSDSEPPSTH